MGARPLEGVWAASWLLPRFREKAMHSRPSQPFAETLIRVSWTDGVFSPTNAFKCVSRKWYLMAVVFRAFWEDLLL